MEDGEAETDMQAEILRYDSNIAEKCMAANQERVEYSDIEA